MTAVYAHQNQEPALNLYCTRDPSQVAEAKYSKATWNKRYAYITMAALTVLAPAALLRLNTEPALLGSFVLLAVAFKFFDRAWRFKAQGDKETQINTKLQELRSMGSRAFVQEFLSRHIDVHSLPAGDLQQAPILALLARIIWREGQAKDLQQKAVRLIGENRFQEALSARVSVCKALVKAGYFAYLINNPHHLKKFKDSFDWVDIRPVDRAFRVSCASPSGNHLAQTREPVPRFLDSPDVRDADNIVKGSGAITHAIATLLN